MPSRRTSSGRSLAALLFAALAVALAAGPAAGRQPPGPGTGAPGLGGLPGQPALDSAGAGRARGEGGGSTRLRGRLGQIVAAARAGTLERAELAGLERASVPGAEGVAVALRLEAHGGEAAIAALEQAGGRVANRSALAVEAYLPPAALVLLATLPGISQASPIIRPVPLGAAGIGQVGEGVAIHGADVWQAAGVTGSGVKVGIIDGGFQGLTSRLSRELPAAIHARCYREIGLYSSTAKSCEAYTDHGTAVAETIADMAPGASLYLADPISQQDLESTVAWMTSNGVKVINISLGFPFEGPGDGTGRPDTIYGAVDQAVKGGALWVNAAGNAGEDGWTGPWADEDDDGLLDFVPGVDSNGILLASGDTIVVSLRWNDTWGASANDYDLYVHGPRGSTPLAGSEDPQTGESDPVESLAFTAPSTGLYRLVVRRHSGEGVSRLQVLVLTSADAALQYRTDEGTLPSPADSSSPGMISVGAVSVLRPDVIQPYSSRGPTLDGRIKPDLVAVDCATTTVLSPFCGTSESAPYTTGAAALVLSARPAFSPAAVATWLRGRAIPLGSPAPNSTFGYGRLNMGPLPAPPAPTTLAFAAQPKAGIAGATLRPQPIVRIRDQDGETLSTGPGSTQTVTLTLAANLTGATLTCAGGPVVVAVAGVATFSGCAINAVGTGYTLSATSGALPPVSSDPLDVLPPGSQPTPMLTVAPSATAIVWGSTVDLVAQVTVPPDAPGAALDPPLGDRSVALESSSDGVAWTAIGSALSDASGAAALSHRPATNLYYRAAFGGAPDLAAATGPPTRVTVRQVAILRPTGGGPTKTIALGRTIAFTTTVRPARPNVLPGSVTYQVYRRIGSAWRLVAVQRVDPDAAGTASLSVTFDQAGLWYVRAMASPTRLNANSLWTPREVYLVR